MIHKQLTMIYDDPENDINLNTECFDTWKQLHMFLFEKGLFPEFQVYLEGISVLHYISPEAKYKCNRECYRTYTLSFSDDVPGSVLFEIVNKHASAQLN